MSLFGSMLRDFDDDPFFGGQRDSMRHMERMMDSFMNPFEGMFGFPQLMGPDSSYHNGGGRPAARRGGGSRSHELMPFGFGRPMFPDINSMFGDMEQMSSNPNCHTFSSSSVVTYSMGDDGQPKMYQASSSTRTAPGGVKETRKTVADSSTGMQKMAIGHHLGERAHVIEKSKNNITGQLDEAQEFVNLEEAEAETFDNEWRMRTSVAMGGGGPSALSYQSATPYEQRRSPQLAIAAGPSGQDRSGRKRDRLENGKLAGGHPYSEKNRKSRSKRSSSSGGSGSSRSRHDGSNM